MGAEIPPPAHTDRKLYPSLCRNPSAAQELPRAREGAFFFTKKAYCVNQTLCVAEGRKSVQTQPPLFPPLKSPSNNGNPFPMRRQRRISEFGEAEFLGAS